MNPLTTSFAPAAAGAAAPSSMPRPPLLPRNTAIALGVVALHVGALWALQSGLLRRAVEMVVPAEVLVEFIEPAKPIVTPPPPAPQPKPQPVQKAPVKPAPLPPAPVPVAIADPTPAPNAPTGTTLPQPPAPPITVAVAPAPAPTPAATPAPAPVAAALGPLADYPDPDIIRVGEDFYFITTTFANAPGMIGLYDQFATERLPGLFSHEIRYQNGNLSLRLLADRALAGQALQPLIASLPTGYRIEMGGSIEEAAKANAALAKVFPVMIAATGVSREERSRSTSTRSGSRAASPQTKAMLMRASTAP